MSRSHNVGIRKEPDWFSLGASALFLSIGALLIGRAVWHIFMHSEVMSRSVISGALSTGLGVLFARQAVKSISS